VPLQINRKQNIDLQFLPEGGNLVMGLKSVVGFKAIGEDGNGTAVSGAIYNSKGEQVVSFATIHNGMGVLQLTPKDNETYTAKIEQPKGVLKSFVLPKVNGRGVVMHIDNPESDDALKVSVAGMNSLPTDSACYLIGTSRGVVYYSQKIELNRPEYTISKKLFPSGIARFTFFKEWRPLNERAVFIDNQDQLNFKISQNKTTYLTRDSVGLEIEVKDKSGIPVQGNFSLAVTDDSQVRADSLGNYNIATSLLINSDLRGHVESPGYYINRKDNQAWRDLDNLMLTQGWTGYDWKDVFAPAKPLNFRVEKDIAVTGTVTNIAKKPVANAPVLISSQKPSFVKVNYTDNNGRYEFSNLPTIDSGSFFIQASNSKGKKMSFGEVTVDKFKPPVILETLNNPIMPWYVNTDSVQLNYVKRKVEKEKEAELKLTGRVIKEVKIKSTKIVRNSFLSVPPDLAFDEQDIRESTVMNLYQFLQQKLPGAKVVIKNLLPTLLVNHSFIDIYVDGLPLPVYLDPASTVDDLIEELSQFQVVQFKSMEVWLAQPTNHPHYSAGQIFNSEDWLRIHGSHDYLFARAHLKTNEPIGTTTISIVTETGRGWFSYRAPDVVTYRPLPLLYPQQFYSPKYDAKPSVIKEADYRSTLFWEPNVVTDANGKAKVYFYTSDITKGYTLNVQGASADGYIGSYTLKLPDQVKGIAKLN
jgi:hypothetical protein